MKMKKTLWNFYTTNEAGWQAMLKACEEAKETIDLEQFIFVTNEIGQKFLEVLIRKAKEGVKIRMIWDAAGSFSFFGSSIATELKEKNIELLFFKTLLPNFLQFHNYKSWYFRNHRRTLIVDSKIGFTGSMCVSDEMKNWRDTVVRIEGPVVKEMDKEFEKMWSRAQHKKVSRTIESVEGDFHYITNTPLSRQHELTKQIIASIRDAKKHIYITTPYFVPTRHLSRVLCRVARKNIDLKIIIPESSDHPFVDMCSRSFFNKMLKAGVKIYLYKGKMIHSKTIVVDDTWASVGTLNLDTVSILYNFEANIVSTDPFFAKELSVHFIQDLLHAEEITYEKWKARSPLEKCMDFFARLLRDFM